MSKSNTEKYIYCDVLPANHTNSYWYISDFDVKPGDFVVAPIRYENTEIVGLILSVRECTSANAPYYFDSTKHLLRPFCDGEEDAKLTKEKNGLMPEKNERFKTDEQLEKIAVQQKLRRNGIEAIKIAQSKRIFSKRLKNGVQKDYILDITQSFDGGFVFSEDGKSIIDFIPKKSGNNRIFIPEGIEHVENMALAKVKISEIFLPKSLKTLGKFTLQLLDGPIGWISYKHELEKIEVSPENEHFYADDKAFYTVSEGKKNLEYVFDKTVETFVVPGDVRTVCNGAFLRCDHLKKVILSEGVEEFDEYAIFASSSVREVHIPKTVKNIKVKSFQETVYEERPRIVWDIDEENPYLFRDEDAVYRVLPDGKLRLIAYMYSGKGNFIIREDTAEIYEQAVSDVPIYDKKLLPPGCKIVNKNSLEDVKTGDESESRKDKLIKGFVGEMEELFEATAYDQPENKFDSLKYDSETKTLSAKMTISQRWEARHSSEESRREAAEKLEPGDRLELYVRPNKNLFSGIFEVLSEDGKFLGGPPNYGLMNIISNYNNEKLNFEFTDAHVSKIVKASERGGRAKYALIEIEFKIKIS